MASNQLYFHFGILSTEFYYRKNVTEEYFTLNILSTVYVVTKMTHTGPTHIVCTYTHMNTHRYTYTHMYTYIYTHTLHTYIHIHTDTQIYISIHTCTVCIYTPALQLYSSVLGVQSPAQSVSQHVTGW